MSQQVKTAAFCTQCRSRCGCIAIVENGILTSIEPDPAHPSGAKLCPKGKAAPELVYHPDRLTTPLRRTSPKGAAQPTWEPMSWDEALDEISERLGSIRDEHGPEQVAFSVTTPSGTHMSDGISWVERFIRAFGSPNTIYSTEICNWHKDVAARFTYGSDIGTPDFANSGCILLWGNNPAATWLARSVEIQKAIKRGAKLIVVDPRPTLYARRADCWLQVRPGTDQALALGIANLLLASGSFDEGFVRQWTNAALLVRQDTGRFLREADVSAGGSADVLLAAQATGESLLRYDSSSGEWQDDPVRADLFASRDVKGLDGPVACKSALQVFADAAAAYPADRVCDLTGVPGEALHAAADLIASSGPVAYYAWNGVGQSITATQTDRAISILYGLTGHYGAHGGNVPGGAARFNDIAGHDLLSEQQCARALGLDERPLGPGRQGWVTARDVYAAILDQKPYPVRALFSFGGNLLAAQPDTARARQALSALDFHVHADFFLNATAEHADIVLPVSTSWEREGLRTGFDASLDGMRKVQLRPAVVAAQGEARSDTDIAMALAARLGLNADMFNGSVDAGHAHILAPSGIDLETLRANPEGVVVETSVALRAYEQAGFATPTRRLEIYSEQLLDIGIDPVPVLRDGALPASPAPGYPLRLGSAKTVIYCHSQGRNIESLRRLMPDPVLEIAQETAAERGIAAGDWLEITTRDGNFIARAKIIAGLAPDTVFAQHGWAVSTQADAPNIVGNRLAANLNSVTSTAQCDPVSGSIGLRCSWCDVRKAALPPA
jgi:anaerobic selenocysteine-containing dehydrogenase